MKAKKLGEFALIHQLTQNLPQNNMEVIVGVGDDCAVLKQNTGAFLLVTCDIQIAGVHFLQNIAKPKQIGEKAIAVNVSDIAAMGGKPTFCLVSLILPDTIKTKYVNALYSAIKTVCGRYNISIIGGNISRGKQLAIDIFMLGEVKSDELLLRSNAKPGDKLLVTGNLGNAAAGLAILKNPQITLRMNEKSNLLAKQFTPQPRIMESSVIAQSKLATAMIDISDGLGSDIGHICRQSKVGVEICEKHIPISNAIIQVAKQLHKNPLTFALSGGEDYELLLTVPSHAVDEIIEKVQVKTGTQLKVIGEILPKKEGKWIVLKNGIRKPIPESGWDHLKK